MNPRPLPGEYGDYFSRYISKVPDGNIIQTLETQILDTMQLLAQFTEDQASHAPRPGKWSLKQVVGHLSDTERVFAYRALWFARGHSVPLPSFEQDDFVQTGDFAGRAFADILHEWQSVRAATVTLFAGLPVNSWGWCGSAAGSPLSARAAAWIIAGHELHHQELIRQQLSSPGGSE